MRVLLFILGMAFIPLCLGMTPDEEVKQATKGAAAGLAGNHAEAVKQFESLAKQGSALGQFLLSQMYTQGKGVPQDHREAFKWCLLSASQGDMLAMHKIGYMYFYGQGVPKNYEEAFKWFSRNSNCSFSQPFLAEMYGQGLYVKKDLKKAKEWFKKACDNGNKQTCEYVDILAKAGY